MQKLHKFAERIVFEEHIPNLGTFTLRYPKSSDAKQMCEYINELSLEGTYITFQGEEISLEDETSYLESQLKKIAGKESIQLLAFIDSTMVGIGGIERKEKVSSHVGILGISLHRDFRKKGLGKKLLNALLSEAKKLPELKIISLEVFANNSVAQKLYTSVGFVEYGRLPNGIRFQGEFVDALYMCRFNE